MSDEVLIPLASMAELDRALKDIVIEFEDAGSRTDPLLEAIGRPFGRTGLRDAADAFEGAWDDKRETLRNHLVELQERVEGVRDAWQQLDLDLQSSLEQNGG
ncbi:hypothetical protein GCM10017608_13530 [Agromyces luteolus]|uniref:Flagellar protein FlgN n=1 Tax=Agromyces luteolus TaxID=88373 RepID=A0A7C9LDK3_9MICO|nr:flagellar protein FlgN [Agromyces luteolus]MUN07652.1 flagellar protein FlgN [Agromyces luteolus]GLK27419.1 hypothetical protein GCM10017608_13530 [Agromyces luteolus]